MQQEDGAQGFGSSASHSSSLLLLTSSVEAAAAWQTALGQHRDHFIVATYRPDRFVVPTFPFTLALVDIAPSTSPDLALKMCRHLREQTQNPILLLTPEQDESYLVDVYKMGVDDCVRKPVSIAVLMAKINVWLRFSRHHPQPPRLRGHVLRTHLSQQYQQ